MDMGCLELQTRCNRRGASSIRRLCLFFEDGSLPLKAAFISALTCCHRFGKIGIQSGTDFLERDCVALAAIEWNEAPDAAEHESTGTCSDSRGKSL